MAFGWLDAVPATLFNDVQGAQLGSAHVGSLKETFRKLLLIFTWWVNRKDQEDNDVFEGGFLVMDNI